MTKETKLGLLVGMAMIIFICILVSDYLTRTQTPTTPDLSRLQVDPSVSPQPVVADIPLPLNEQQSEPVISEVSTERNSAGPQRLTRVDSLVLPEPDVLVIGGTDLTESQLEPAPGPDIAPEPQPQPAPQPQPQPQPQPAILVAPATPPLAIHHVQPKESLWDISLKHYGDGKYYKNIYEANRDKMRSPDAMRVGVRLVIPRLDPSPADPASAVAPAPVQRASSPAPARAAPANSKPRFVEYTIRESDTLSSIARKYYGSSRDLPKLLELNAQRIDDPDVLVVGQVIRVPAQPR